MLLAVLQEFPLWARSAETSWEKHQWLAGVRMEGKQGNTGTKQDEIHYKARQIKGGLS